MAMQPGAAALHERLIVFACVVAERHAARAANRESGAGSPHSKERHIDWCAEAHPANAVALLWPFFVAVVPSWSRPFPGLRPFLVSW